MANIGDQRSNLIEAVEAHQPFCFVTREEEDPFFPAVEDISVQAFSRSINSPPTINFGHQIRGRERSVAKHG